MLCAVRLLLSCMYLVLVNLFSNDVQVLYIIIMLMVCTGLLIAAFVVVYAPLIKAYYHPVTDLPYSLLCSECSFPDCALQSLAVLHDLCDGCVGDCHQTLQPNDLICYGNKFVIYYYSYCQRVDYRDLATIALVPTLLIALALVLLLCGIAARVKGLHKRAATGYQTIR